MASAPPPLSLHGRNRFDGQSALVKSGGRGVVPAPCPTVDLVATVGGEPGRGELVIWRPDEQVVSRSRQGVGTAVDAVCWKPDGEYRETRALISSLPGECRHH